MRQLLQELRLCAFLKSSCSKTNMAPLRGWAPCGSRLIAKVPHRHWQTTTLLAALRHDGIAAPWLLEGPIDGESFDLCREGLAPDPAARRHRHYVQSRQPQEQ